MKKFDSLKLVLDFADKHPFLVGFICACISLAFVKQDIIYILQHL
jgi:hypothetical protein